MLIVLNDGRSAQTFDIRDGDERDDLDTARRCRGDLRLAVKMPVAASVGSGACDRIGDPPGEEARMTGRRRSARMALLLGTLFASPGEAADAPASAKPLFREFMGVCGHTIQFKPDLYAPVCRAVRDYHPLDWDTGDDTSFSPPFPFARNGVDWGRSTATGKPQATRPTSA